MSFRIVFEKSADLTADYIKENSDLLYEFPMSFTMDGTEYLDSALSPAMNTKEFYDKLRGGSMSTTSMLNTERLKELISPFLEAGEDVLYLCFSSGLSGTYQAAKIAEEELTKQYPERKIIVVDTLMASMGQGLTVFLSEKEARKGKTIEEVAQFVTDNALHLAAWFTVDDLHFLKRGGRVSGVTAVVGTLLNIKPVLHVDNEGHLISVSKAKGRKAALRALAEKARDTINRTETQMMISHSDAAEDAETLRQMVMEMVAPDKEIIVGEIGPVIGSHCGPGTMALFFYTDQR